MSPQSKEAGLAKAGAEIARLAAHEAPIKIAAVSSIIRDTSSKENLNARAPWSKSSLPCRPPTARGVKLRRSLGSQRGLHVDPFLMLDEFYSDNPNDYLAGFPAHPHRGFETVTYMLDGHMRHEDHLGNRGDLGPGDVQWMTAARGIIHSEMPQQSEGRMRGFQLWLNLPSGEKMKPARYRDIPGREDSAREAAAGRGSEGHCRHT